MSSRRTTLVVVGLLLAFLAPMSTAYALWSRTASATVDVTVQPAAIAPAIDCGAFVTNGAFTITWTNVAGLTYSVHRATPINTDATYVVQTASTTSPYTAAMPNGTTTYWRVKASNGTTTSGWSNTVRLVRSGNGNGSPNHKCDPVTP